MKCKVCNKNIMEHSKKQAMECLESADISVKNVDPMTIMSSVGVSAVVNHRHKTIRYDGGEIKDSKDIETDMLRICLTGKGLTKKLPFEVPDKKEVEEKDGDSDK